MRYFIIFCLFIGLYPSAQAQDLHFSQYHLAPLHLNPALTGFMDQGNHRLLFKHRNQWSSVFNNQNTNFSSNEAFQSIYASYDMRWCNNGDYWAVGGHALRDWVGEPEFSLNQAHFSLGYHKRLRGGKSSTFISAGFQAGFNHYNFDESGLRFDAQFDSELGYQSNAPSMEDFTDRNNLWFFDFSGGLTVYTRHPSYDLVAGVAVTHLGPRREFIFLTNTTFPEEEKLERTLRLTGHLSLRLPFKPKSQTAILFRTIYVHQNPHWQLLPMVLFHGRLGSKRSLYFNSIAIGPGVRLTDNKAVDNTPILVDAAVLSLEFNVFNGLRLGLAYDFNVSPLAKASKGFGSFELSLGYQFGTLNDKECQKFDCPYF